MLSLTQTFCAHLLLRFHSVILLLALLDFLPNWHCFSFQLAVHVINFDMQPNLDETVQCCSPQAAQKENWD